MKFFLIFLVYFLVLYSSITTINPKSSEKLTNESGEISDEELNELLKDPKYASIAEGMGLSPDMLKTSTSKKSNKANDLEGGRGVTKTKNHFKSFKFISKDETKQLFELLSQPLYSEYLPAEAKMLIKNGMEFNTKIAENKEINQYLLDNLKNSENSESFIDPDGGFARKGISTFKILEHNSTSNYQKCWLVVNTAVTVLYSGDKKYDIIKSGNNKNIRLDDLGGSPCITLKPKNNVHFKGDSVLLCFSSLAEKQNWVKTLLLHIIK